MNSIVTMALPSSTTDCNIVMSDYDVEKPKQLVNIISRHKILRLRLIRATQQYGHTIPEYCKIA